ncbi:MAG: substrate-binding domain-containing protein, partial [Prosthecobacter sp.]|nr:substrate-binding domain-containing protein [Prosthecobacter sp.]
MNRKTLALLLLLAALALLGLAWKQSQSEGDQASLVVYCGAGLKKPVEDVAKQYESEFGIKVDLQYGGSGTLLSQIRVAKRGDL